MAVNVGAVLLHDGAQSLHLVGVDAFSVVGELVLDQVILGEVLNQVHLEVVRTHKFLAPSSLQVVEVIGETLLCDHSVQVSFTLESQGLQNSAVQLVCNTLENRILLALELGISLPGVFSIDKRVHVGELLLLEEV